MYQGLAQEITAVMPAAVTSGLFDSTVTVEQPDGLLIGAGQPGGNWVTVLDSIPCMDSPKGIERILAQEKKSLPDIEAFTFKHILLAGYYGNQLPWSTPRPQLRALVTGADGNTITYEVGGIESDSQQQMTRLALFVATE